MAAAMLRGKVADGGTAALSIAPSERTCLDLRAANYSASSSPRSRCSPVRARRALRVQTYFAPPSPSASPPVSSSAMPPSRDGDRSRGRQPRRPPSVSPTRGVSTQCSHWNRPTIGDELPVRDALQEPPLLRMHEVAIGSVARASARHAAQRLAGSSTTCSAATSSSSGRRDGRDMRSCRCRVLFVRVEHCDRAPKRGTTSTPHGWTTTS
jgi:hypothetical protein